MSNYTIRNMKYFLMMCALAGCGERVSQQARIEEGRQLYLGNGCAVCHGKNGDGDGLASQTFYPLPTDLHDVTAYQQGSSLKAIQRTIKEGMKKSESGMPAFEHFTKKELQQLSYYLQSLHSDVSTLEVQ